MKTLFSNNYVIIDIIIRNYDVRVSVTDKISYVSVLIFNMTHLSMTSIQDHYVIDDVFIYHYDVKVTVTHILSLSIFYGSTI